MEVGDGPAVAMGVSVKVGVDVGAAAPVGVGGAKVATAIGVASDGVGIVEGCAQATSARAIRDKIEGQKRACRMASIIQKACEDMRG